MKVKVLNLKNYKKGCKDKMVKEIYIGRGSVFGNRFVMGKDGSRESVIRKYRMDLKHKDKIFWKNIETLRMLVHAGYEIRLLCFCSPLTCHGNIIKSLILHH